MLLVIYGNEERNEHELYNNRAEYIKDSFTRQFETAETLEFSLSLKGKQFLTAQPQGATVSDYEKKKTLLKEIAWTFDYLVHWYGLDLFYSEWAEIGEWLAKNAKRYGLKEEFEINGII